jgi:hypothetical protein
VSPRRATNRRGERSSWAFSTRWTAFSEPRRRPDGGTNPGTRSPRSNRPWPHVAPQNARTIPVRQRPESQNIIKRRESVQLEIGRSRTRTWDLFLIRNTLCPLQSPQLANNPCKLPDHRPRKGTGGDWREQAGGPMVAPRPPVDGVVSCGPEADIMPTIRSSPDAPEAARCAPA